MNPRGAGESTDDSRHDFPIVLASMPPTARQRRLALGVIIVLSLAALFVAPFASVQAARVDAFIPVLQTVICVADLATAFLLFAQYTIQPQRALLVLAGGYMCSGLFAFLQTLAFPGAYASAGLIGDGTNSAAWLFVLWRTPFPVAVILYTLWKDRSDRPARPERPAYPAIAIAIACVVVLTTVMTWLVTEHVAHLPGLYQGVTRQSLLAHYVNVFLWMLAAVTIGFLYLRARTVLDLWLMVTLFAWLPDFTVAILFTFVRFSVGWYTGRAYALIASCTVLAFMLIETTVLYSRLAAAIALQRRERSHRLMSIDAATAAIAHELRQPLGAIVLNGAAASTLLGRQPVDVPAVSECLQSMIDSSHDADHVVSGIRALFKPSAEHRAMIDVVGVMRKALALVELDLQAAEVTVTTEYQDDLPPFSGDSAQLQQVILNLVRNAMEAMDSLPREGRYLRMTARRAGSDILLSVEDSGSGITVENQARIFDTFFTSKPAGMGLGLPICRAIVESHGGRLRLAKTHERGTVFEIALPITEN